MTKALVFSDHFYNSRMQASAHWLVDALVRYEDVDVTFVSTPLSVFNILKRDYRLRYLRRGTTYHKGVKLDTAFWLLGGQNLYNGVVNRLFHNLWLKRAFIRRAKAVLARHGRPDLIVFEGGFCTGVYPTIREMLPDVPVVHLVTDDVRTVGMPDPIIEIDQRLHSEATLVICCSPGLLNAYPRGIPMYNGPDFEVVADDSSNPYPPDDTRTKVLSVGTMLFDRRAVEGAATLLPEFAFHVIGPRKAGTAPKNVLYYGEVPFEETLRYIRHADIGIAPYKDAEGVSYIAHSSLKIKQYSHFNKPIVCPDFAVPASEGFYAYSAGDAEGLASAIVRARSGPGAQSMIPKGAWRQMVRMIVGLAAPARLAT